MKRIVSVWLPDWPITVWSRAPGRSAPPETAPFALIERGARGLTLLAVNAAARRQGLVPGQPHADARAILPQLVSAPAEPDRDAAALHALALWAERYSPTVAIDAGPSGQEGLLIDMTGGAHLFGGEQMLLGDMARRLKTAAIPARLALADTAGAAWGMARFGERPRLIPAGQVREAVARLPVAALRLDEADNRLLRKFGLKRIGDLLALPRAGLARRFRGEAGLTLVRRLDQALGVEPEPLEPLRRAPAYRVWRSFVEPVIDVAGIETVLADLSVALAEALEKDSQGARRLALTGFRTDGAVTRLAVAISAPSATPSHLARLLRERGLDRLDLGFGVDAMMLSAERTEPLVASQGDLERGQDADAVAALPALLDRLSARLGEAAVHQVEAVESWLPERSERLIPAGQPRARTASAPALPDRPLLLLDPPEPVESVAAEVPDGPPRRFVWRRATRRAVRFQGPERLSPEWWLPPGSAAGARTRDYYKVEDDEGRRYWLFREGLYGREDAGQAPSWWIHGLFP